MALVNKDYNLFTALNLPGKSFQDINQISPQLNLQTSNTQTSQFKHIVCGSGKVDLSSHQQFINCVDYSISIRQIQQGRKQMKSEEPDLLQESKNQINESLQDLKDFIINSTQQYWDKINSFLDQNEKYFNLDTIQIQTERLNSDMLNIQEQIKILFKEIKFCQRQDSKIIINMILKQTSWNNISKTILIPQQNNIFQQTIHPLIPYFSKHSNSTDRVLLINFGKETYINLRAVATKTQIMYISFFSQHNVQSQYCKTQNQTKNSIDLNFNSSYAQFISQQFQQSNENLLKNKPNFKNILLFPLNLFVPSDYDRLIEGQAYQQFGVSSDIHYLFRNICINKIKKYKPTKVIVYVDGTTIIDPYHFADIIKFLSESCHNNIILSFPQSKFIMNTKSNFLNNNFFSKYMNHQIKNQDVLRMKNYLTAFMNVTSKQYYPISINITSPSQLFRNTIRYDYIDKHIKTFPYMKRIMKKIQPSEEEISIHKKMIQQYNKEIKQKKDSIPYYSLIKELQIKQQNSPIHYNKIYNISKDALLYQILKRPKIFEHKFILKLGKQKNKQQILNSIKSLRFYLFQQSTTSYKSISLQNYSQIFVTQKKNKMIVTIFNYFDQKQNNHLILRGIAALNQNSVFLHNVKEKTFGTEQKSIKTLKTTSSTENNYVYCGYNNTSNTIMDRQDVYYTWPLKINIKENFCAMIKGQIYKPQISDRIIKLQTEDNLYQYCVFTRNQQIMKNQKKYSNLLFYGAIFIQKPPPLLDQKKQVQSLKLSLELKACGGYSFEDNSHNLFKIKFIDNTQCYSYVVQPQDIYQKQMINFPPLLSLNTIIQLVGKEKRREFTFYGGKSPLFRTYRSKNIAFVPQKSKLTNEDKQSKINSSIVQCVNEPGIFNTLQTYPNNKIVQKYFNQSTRLRYIFSVHQITLCFDQKYDEQQFQEILFQPVQNFRFDQQIDDDQVSIQVCGEKLYLQLLFHSPLSKNQPYYMSIDYKNIIQNDCVKIHRSGYYIQTRVSDTRFYFGQLQCIIDFVGNLHSSIFKQGLSYIKMNPISIRFLSNRKQFKPFFLGIEMQ